MKAHGLFTIWTPDEVAECLDGVPKELYAKIWNEIVPKMPRQRNMEDIGPSDVVGINSLSEWWNEFTEDEQRLLNSLAEKNDASKI